MRILAHHLHAHSLGSVSEEEELLRHPMDDHLQGIPDLYMGMEAVSLQLLPADSPMDHSRISSAGVYKEAYQNLALWYL